MGIKQFCIYYSFDNLVWWLWDSFGTRELRDAKFKVLNDKKERTGSSIIFITEIK